MRRCDYQQCIVEQSDDRSGGGAMRQTRRGSAPAMILQHNVSFRDSDRCFRLPLTPFLTSSTPRNESFTHSKVGLAPSHLTCTVAYRLGTPFDPSTLQPTSMDAFCLSFTINPQANAPLRSL